MTKPFFVERLERSDPDLLNHLTALQDFAARDGALPAKIKTLMSMLVDAVLGHAEGVKAIAERARAQGASEDEIAETVRVAFYCAGIPALVTATSAYREKP